MFDLSSKHDRTSSQLTNCTLPPEPTNHLTPQQQHAALLQQVGEAVELIELEKVQQIRVSQWVAKLSNCPNNPVWSKNINFYLSALLLMVRQRQLHAPFSHPPPNATLPTLTPYDLPYPLREQLQPSQSHTSRSKGKPSAHSTSKQKGKHNNSFHKKIYIVDQLDYNLSSQTVPLQQGLNPNHSGDEIEMEELCMEQVIRPLPSTNSKARSRHSGYKSHSRTRKATPTPNPNKENQSTHHNQAVSRKLFDSKEKRLKLTERTDEASEVSECSVIKYLVEAPSTTPNTDILIEMLDKCTDLVRCNRKDLEHST